MGLLQNKLIVIGVSGGIAAYKSVEILRQLQKEGASVRVIMTRNAAAFVGPLTFEALSGYSVYMDVVEKDVSGEIRHISWADKADAVIIAPATANMIGKIANGIADDALSTFIMAVRTPVLICPAMNSNMYESRAVQRNLDCLEADGFHVLEPDSGELACGVTGPGRLPDPPFIVDRLKKVLSPSDLKGKRVLVSAGPTIEPIDPVRYISNHSSGKMGYEIARAAEYRGAEVKMVTGKTSLPVPFNVSAVNVLSAAEMYEAMIRNMDDADIIIKVAAVADYRVKDVAEHKIKKTSDDMIIKLEKNPDILKAIGEKKKNQFLVGFAAETRDLRENALAKLKSKNLDMIVGNVVSEEGSGFGSDTNRVTLFYADGNIDHMPVMGKDAVANALIDRILARII
ncbi:bifunctional phosphopantothenoylcysteine decarboxylase/phosphopantothenate--cysteine ligase CoaBC [Desulforegula conservatrix]|uniref:bifunctional phosphopantothenoylcysteine decarboxylase/phosphopantothenate--cysteine ligase CoaBC n=1 Tax=Desulforegula conservatrix TaxID=153026 RepID=UPI00040FCAD5|nr:bifunctional phosphopantothenoylcysteine decarboxylase/phosphopantothenate--cysteine ligase CoaBC [Desulforegula conservatrix]